MAAIGSLFLRLAVDSSALESGLSRVQAKVASVGAKLGSLLTSPLRAARGLGSLPGAAVGGFLQPVRDLVSGIPFVGGALGGLLGGGQGIFAHIEQRIGAFTETTR